MAARLHDGINDCALTRIPVNSTEAITLFNGPDLQLVAVFNPLNASRLSHSPPQELSADFALA